MYVSSGKWGQCCLRVVRETIWLIWSGLYQKLLVKATSLMVSLCSRLPVLDIVILIKESLFRAEISTFYFHLTTANVKMYHKDSGSNGAFDSIFLPNPLRVLFWKPVVNEQLSAAAQPSEDFCPYNWGLLKKTNKKQGLQEVTLWCTVV